ncbi:TetR/AcrR family transcriptional regulator [Sneathiella chinensis]|uniref:TetR family transcriptional regulator n=1 Tax=Sneathiella chinensis TaxID=349750 RepID=A0ABQ5U4W0_9PROT|nr:TetR/AcrR family transcriptional regulator [Sneathiella chinensis]GLQ06763.1 TetR family transcriptional regulator [Sneathiella chinensis]
MSELSNSRNSATNDRRAAIIAAAADLFFEHGYSATSVDAVIARVGGSKRNVYQEFGSKEGLFAAIVTEIADSALGGLNIDDTESRDLGEILRSFGCKLLQVYMSPALIGVLRIVMAEAPRFPELARAVYERGPGRSSDCLVKVLENARSRGEVRITDCQLAAENFMGMLRDNFHMQVALGLKASPSETEIAARVASVVDSFLYGICVR